MHVLITGGCGFVGANLIAKLSSVPGVKLRVLDNESLGKREHLGSFAGDFRHGDIRDRTALDNALDGIDAVVHLAADTRVIDSIDSPRYNFEVNVVGSLNLLDSMRARKIGRLVSASTGGAIIGHAAGAVHEGMVAAPLAPYGASKLAVEGYCSAYSECYGVKSASLRFSNVFGPRSFHKGSVVAAFFKNLLAGKPLEVYGDGTQVRDYVYVEDICEGIYAALQSSASGPIQLGSGQPTMLNDLIERIKTVTQRDFEVRYNPPRTGEIHSTYCNVEHARNVLGFKPRQDLKAPLATTWQWFQSQA